MNSARTGDNAGSDVRTLDSHGRPVPAAVVRGREEALARALGEMMKDLEEPPVVVTARPGAVARSEG